MLWRGHHQGTSYVGRPDGLGKPYHVAHPNQLNLKWPMNATCWHLLTLLPDGMWLLIPENAWTCQVAKYGVYESIQSYSALRSSIVFLLLTSTKRTSHRNKVKCFILYIEQNCSQNKIIYRLYINIVFSVFELTLHCQVTSRPDHCPMTEQLGVELEIMVRVEWNDNSICNHLYASIVICTPDSDTTWDLKKKVATKKVNMFFFYKKTKHVFSEARWFLRFIGPWFCRETKGGCPGGHPTAHAWGAQKTGDVSSDTCFGFRWFCYVFEHNRIEQVELKICLLFNVFVCKMFNYICVLHIVCMMTWWNTVYSDAFCLCHDFLQAQWTKFGCPTKRGTR